MFGISELKQTRVYQQGREEGREQGREEGIRQVAMQMKAAGMASAEIAQITGLSAEKVESL